MIDSPEHLAFIKSVTAGGPRRVADSRRTAALSMRPVEERLRAYAQVAGEAPATPPKKKGLFNRRKR